jgi:hypothetical protein
MIYRIKHGTNGMYTAQCSFEFGAEWKNIFFCRLRNTYELKSSEYESGTYESREYADRVCRSFDKQNKHKVTYTEVKI